MKILAVSLPLRLRARLMGRLKQVEVHSVNTAAELGEALIQHSFVLLIVQENAEVLETLRIARQGYGGPIFFCASQPHPEEYLRRLLTFRVTAILQQPIDPDELVRCAAVELGIRVAAQENGAVLEMPPNLMAIWRRLPGGGPGAELRLA